MKELVKIIGLSLLILCGLRCRENRIASYYDMSVQSYFFGEYVDGDGNIYQYDNIHKVMVKQEIQNEKLIEENK